MRRYVSDDSDSLTFEPMRRTSGRNGKMKRANKAKSLRAHRNGR